MRPASLYSFVLLVTLVGCGAQSKTTCNDPNSSDPACILDSRRDSNIIGGAAAEAEVPFCTAEREGRISFVKATGAFKLCTAGENIDIAIAGPQGPVGPPGAAGTPAEGSTNGQSISGLLAPGASLSLNHGLNTTMPLAEAYFARNGLLRPVSQYQSLVGKRTITVAGASWQEDFRPQVVALRNGRVAVIRENWPDNLSRNVVIDLYDDEGQQLQLSTKVLPQLKTVRALALSNGLLVVYEPYGSTDEYFTVIGNDGTELIAPTVFALSPGNNRIKDLKLLSNGHVVVAEQSAGNAASFHIINPNNGTMVASNLSVATSSDPRTVVAPLDGKFLLFFSDVLMTPKARVAVINNDGSIHTAPAEAGLDDETVMGSERIAADRIAVVTSFFNNASTTLFDADLNVIRPRVVYSPLSSDGASPVSLGQGNWVVCSSRSEGLCVTYDREGLEVFRNGDLFASNDTGDFAAITALGGEGRFAISSRNEGIEGGEGTGAGVITFLQGAVGRLDLEIIDSNTVRVVNRTVENLPVMIKVSR